MKDYPGIEAALELAETTLDQLGKDSLLSDLPLVGLAFKVCRSVAGIRDRLYVAKLRDFVLRLHSISSEERETMLANVLPDFEERERLGERLLMLLEQISDREKPQIMAVFFIAFLRKRIDLPTLLRCWDAIATAYFGDLAILLGLENGPAIGGRNSHLHYLLRSGLSTIRVVNFGDDADSELHVVSPFGRLFFEVYRETTANCG